mmetsp:Transcript_65255/g.182484  ORF Transcript_65255/g.182484 Transcript_65255/m.182484 type:complete len:218 (+) Transcript_65255:974-1627(+)
MSCSASCKPWESSSKAVPEKTGSQSSSSSLSHGLHVQTCNLPPLCTPICPSLVTKSVPAGRPIQASSGCLGSKTCIVTVRILYNVCKRSSPSKGRNSSAHSVRASSISKHSSCVPCSMPNLDARTLSAALRQSSPFRIFSTTSWLFFRSVLPSFITCSVAVSTCFLLWTSAMSRMRSNSTTCRTVTESESSVSGSMVSKTPSCNSLTSTYSFIKSLL